MTRTIESWLDPDEPEHAVDDLSTDDLFAVFASEERRHALAYLARVGDPVTVDTLVAHVANETAAIVPGGDALDRLRLEFHHNHLPRMADADLIRYDDELVELAVTDRSVGSPIA